MLETKYKELDMAISNPFFRWEKKKEKENDIQVGAVACEGRRTSVFNVQIKL